MNDSGLARVAGEEQFISPSIIQAEEDERFGYGAEQRPALFLEQPGLRAVYGGGGGV